MCFEAWIFQDGQICLRVGWGDGDDGDNADLYDEDDDEEEDDDIFVWPQEEKG